MLLYQHSRPTGPVRINHSIDDNSITYPLGLSTTIPKKLFGGGKASGGLALLISASEQRSGAGSGFRTDKSPTRQNRSQSHRSPSAPGEVCHIVIDMGSGKTLTFHTDVIAITRYVI